MFIIDSQGWKAQMKKFKWSEIIIPFLTLLIGLLISPIKSYLEKDFSDLATKKNISDITQKVEEVKSFYTSRLDSLRESLSRESEVLSRRRDIYTKIAKSARVFIRANVTNERREDFLNNYSEIWLWAPDKVIKKLNAFLDLQIRNARGEIVSQKVLKGTYNEFILEMRRDAGFTNTRLRNNEFKYFYFIN